jgi:hypothetical protein
LTSKFVQLYPTPKGFFFQGELLELMAGPAGEGPRPFPEMYCDIENCVVRPLAASANQSGGNKATTKSIGRNIPKLAIRRWMPLSMGLLPRGGGTSAWHLAIARVRPPKAVFCSGFQEDLSTALTVDGRKAADREGASAVLIRGESLELHREY